MGQIVPSFSPRDAVRIMNTDLMQRKNLAGLQAEVLQSWDSNSQGERLCRIRVNPSGQIVTVPASSLTHSNLT